MIQYLEDMKGKGAPALTQDEREELNRLRKIADTKNTKFLSSKKVTVHTSAPADSDEDSEVLNPFESLIF